MLLLNVFLSFCVGTNIQTNEDVAIKLVSAVYIYGFVELPHINSLSSGYLMAFGA